MDLLVETHTNGCVQRRASVCAKRYRPYPTNESQPGSMAMPRCLPAQHQHMEILAGCIGRQRCLQPWGSMPAGNCLAQQQPGLVHVLHLQAPPQLACPTNMMGAAMNLCARSLGTTMEALQQAGQLCEVCPEAAAAERALCRAEQLMAETIRRVRLTLRLAVSIKQQQQQLEQPWVCTRAGMAMLPAAGAPAVKAAAAAAAHCDPSTADSACSGSVGQPVLSQLMPFSMQGGCSMQVLCGQKQQQHCGRQGVVQFAQQGADVLEEVASSWE